MSESKHTPGPWTVEKMKTRRGCAPGIYGSDGAIVAGRHADDEQSRWDANAALIAAAPELLKHCQTMLSWWEKNPDVLKRFPTLAIDEIRAAIRKAEGGAA